MIVIEIVFVFSQLVLNADECEELVFDSIGKPPNGNVVNVGV